MSTIILELPIPPSVNNYWGFHGHQRFLTPKAKEFKQEVWLEAKKKFAPCLAQRLKVGIRFHFGNKIRRDIDNYIKSLLDALTQARVWEDDSLIDELHVYRGDIIKGGKTEVWIEVLDKE